MPHAPRPKVLYLVHRVPYPPDRGDRIRSFRWLECLSEQADVYLAFLSQESPSASVIKSLERYCRRVAAVCHSRSRWLRGVWSLARGRTATEGLFRSPELQHLIRAWTEETRFDAVVFYCSSMAQYLSVPGLDGVRAVGDLVDVDSQKWLDYAACSRSLKRFLYALEGRRLRRLETALPGRAAALALTTEAEAALFRSFCPTDRLHVVPNGVDRNYFRPQPTPAASGQRCTFVGALDYQANIDGITWFCREIWPEVRRRRPAATFTLVGSNPGPAVRRIASQPGVTLAANVPDVRPYLSDAAVVVVPLRIARGIQNKILEALAMAKAVVATPQAIEGIDVEPGVHVCAATTVSQWIETTVALLDDPDRRDRLGQAGLAYVEENHQWRASMIHFNHLLGVADPRTIACTPEPVGTATKPAGETQ